MSSLQVVEPAPASPLAEPAFTPQRVLIVKPSSLGDVISAMPVLRGLRRTFPQAHVAWLVAPSCADVIAHDSQLDETILFERKRLGQWWRAEGRAALRGLLESLRDRRFDWVVDLQGLIRSELLAWFSGARLRAGFAQVREGTSLLYTHRIATVAEHTIDRNIELARRLGVDARAEDFTLEVSAAGRAFADRLCGERSLTPKRYLVCVPPTRWTTKLYPSRHWRRVVGALAEHCPVVLVGSPDEKPLVDAVAAEMGDNVVNLAGQTRVGELVGVVAASAGVVCSDSAAQFIAPAVGTPVLTLVGPTVLAKTGPYGRGGALVSPVACQGCLKRRCRHNCCMELINPDMVVSAVREMMECC